jgi:hypothetical protein
MEQPPKKVRSARQTDWRKKKSAARGYGAGGQQLSRTQLVAQAQQAQQQAKTQRQAATHLHGLWMRECDAHDRTTQVSATPDTDTPVTHTLNHL